jgi:hypothetical protein
MSAVANNLYGAPVSDCSLNQPLRMSGQPFLGNRSRDDAWGNGSVAQSQAQRAVRPVCAISYEETDDPVQIININGFTEPQIYDRQILEECLKLINLSPFTKTEIKDIISYKSEERSVCPITGEVARNPVESDEIPVCPITREVPKNPVQILTQEGVLEPAIYDKEALKKWKEQSNTSPISRQQIRRIVPYKKPQPIENDEHLTLGQKILKTAKKTGINALKVLGSMALTLTCTAGYAIVGAGIGVAVLEGAALLTALIVVALVICLIVFVIANTPPPEVIHPRPGIAPSPLPPPGPNTPLFPPGLKALPLKLAKAGAIAGAVLGAAIGMNVGIRVSKNVFWEGQDLFSEENKDIFFLKV